MRMNDCFGAVAARCRACRPCGEECEFVSRSADSRVFPLQPRHRSLTTPRYRRNSKSGGRNCRGPRGRARRAVEATMLKDAGCPVGLSVYALPKTGSSFLGRFLKSLSVHLHVCMVLELKAECGTLVRVGCPPEWGGRRAAPLASCVPKSEGCSWGWLVSNTQALEKRCCTLGGGDTSFPGNDTQYTECSRVRTSTLVHSKKVFKSYCGRTEVGTHYSELELSTQ